VGILGVDAACEAEPTSNNTHNARKIADDKQKDWRIEMG
jgi:hypothetical protein